MRRFGFIFLFLLAATSAMAGQPRVKNVIYLIGDGMGIAQVTAAMTESDRPLAIERAQYAGLAATRSADNLITDSAAGGTALATGTKTNNKMIGQDPAGNPLESIMAIASRNGMATGLVATVSITDATPAAFYAHVASRTQSEDIAAQFTASGIDAAIGGGAKYFGRRSDGRNLFDDLRAEGYTVVRTVDSMEAAGTGRLVAILADQNMPYVKDGRPADYLQNATNQAIKVLKASSKKGFLLMVEGSMIDYACHSNDYERMLGETYDFDRAVGVAMDFADANPGTLVVVTADHETGGLTLPASNIDVGNGRYDNLKSAFSTGGHTASMVGVYAYGPGASEFTGIMDNTDIPKKIAKLLRLK